MYKSMTITFSEPICGCKKIGSTYPYTYNMEVGSYNNVATENTRVGVTVTCQKCRTQLRIPTGTITIGFVFENDTRQASTKKVETEEKDPPSASARRLDLIDDDPT